MRAGVSGALLERDLEMGGSLVAVDPTGVVLRVVGGTIVTGRVWNVGLNVKIC